MSMERLKAMKEVFMCAVEGQMHNLQEVDAEELGEVVDMIKDLEEAMYYCSVVKAMEDSDKEQEILRKYGMSMMNNGGGNQYDNGMMYYTPTHSGNGNRGGQSWGNSSSNGGYSRSSSSGNGNSSSRNYGEYGMPTEREFPYAFQDDREGRSPRSRRMYMEAKETKQDKSAQMKELERYAQELTQDVIEMIQDASPEERQFLSRKIAALSNKVNQIND